MRRLFQRVSTAARAAFGWVVNVGAKAEDIPVIGWLLALPFLALLLPVLAVIAIGWMLVMTVLCVAIALPPAMMLFLVTRWRGTRAR